MYEQLVRDAIRKRKEGLRAFLAFVRKKTTGMVVVDHYEIVLTGNLQVPDDLPEIYNSVVDVLARHFQFNYFQSSMGVMHDILKAYGDSLVELTVTRKQDRRFRLIIQAAGFTKEDLPYISDFRLRYQREQEMRRSKLQILIGHLKLHTFEARHEYQVTTVVQANASSIAKKV